MTFDERAQGGYVIVLGQRIKIDAGAIAFSVSEIAGFVEDISDAATHPGGEIASAFAEYDRDTARHVFASVIAHAFNDSSGAGIANGKAFAGESVEEGFAGGGTVEGNVADDDVLFWREARGFRRKDDEASTGEALADVVVSFAFQREGYAGREEGAETLSSGTVESEAHGVIRKTLRSVTPDDFAADHSADGAVNVLYRQMQMDRLLLFQCGACVFDETIVECLFESVILRLSAAARNA